MKLVSGGNLGGLRMIPITKPQIDDKEIEAVKRVLQSGWLVRGKKVEEFEERLKDFIDVPYAIATTSCTTALHLALMVLGIGRGDEVIIPAFTWVATANVVEMVGATPVFVDVHLDTYNIDPNLIKRAITKKTKAIMPVHLFGLSADMKPILKLAEKYNLKVIEDCACSLGTLYRGKHTGTWGDVGCFSFHPRKVITTGEGGLFITKDKKLYEKALAIHDHGGTKYKLVGSNYRMTDIQGAIGIEQMKKLPDILNKRLERAMEYKFWTILSPTPLIPFPNSNHTYQSYVLLTHRSNGERIKKLAKKGIATIYGTQSVPMLPYYRDKYHYQSNSFPNTEYLRACTLTIPLYANMTNEEQEYVQRNVENSFSR